MFLVGLRKYGANTNCGSLCFESNVFFCYNLRNSEANSSTTGINSEDVHAHIEYAGVNMAGEIIHCYRNNLTLKENDAKELRKEFSAPSQVKIGEIGIGKQYQSLIVDH